MISTVKKKLYTTGNGAEFSNNEPVSIDGIVIQNIVFLKFSGGIDKIIIDSKISYLDIGIGDHIF